MTNCPLTAPRMYWRQRSLVISPTNHGWVWWLVAAAWVSAVVSSATSGDELRVRAASDAAPTVADPGASVVEPTVPAADLEASAVGTLVSTIDFTDSAVDPAVSPVDLPDVFEVDASASVCSTALCTSHTSCIATVGNSEIASGSTASSSEMTFTLDAFCTSLKDSRKF